MAWIYFRISVLSVLSVEYRKLNKSPAYWVLRTNNVWVYCNFFNLFKYIRKSLKIKFKLTTITVANKTVTYCTIDHASRLLVNKKEVDSLD